MAQASAEKIEHTGSAEKERVASASESSWHVRQSRLFRVPDCKVRESQDEQESHLGERKGNQGGRMKRKEWAPQRKKAGSKEEIESKQEQPP